MVKSAQDIPNEPSPDLVLQCSLWNVQHYLCGGAALGDESSIHVNVIHILTK